MQKVCVLILLIALSENVRSFPQKKWSRPIPNSEEQHVRERRQFPFGEWIPLNKACPTCQPLVDPRDVSQKDKNVGLAQIRPTTVTRQTHSEGNFFPRDDSSFLSVPPPPPKSVERQPVSTSSSSFQNVQFHNIPTHFNNPLPVASQVFQQTHPIQFFPQPFLNNQNLLVNTNPQTAPVLNNAVFQQNHAKHVVAPSILSGFNSNFKEQKFTDNIVLDQSLRAKEPSSGFELQFPPKPTFLPQQQHTVQHSQQQTFGQQPVVQQNFVSFRDSILTPPPVSNGTQGNLGSPKEEIQLLYVPVETLRQRGSSQPSLSEASKNIQFQSRPSSFQQPSGSLRPTESSPTTTQHIQTHFVNSNRDNPGDTLTTLKLSSVNPFSTVPTPATVFFHNVPVHPTPQSFVSTSVNSNTSPFVTQSPFTQKFTSFTPSTTLSHLGAVSNSIKPNHFGTTPNSIITEEGLQEEIINGKPHFSNFPGQAFHQHQIPIQQLPKQAIHSQEPSLIEQNQGNNQFVEKNKTKPSKSQLGYQKIPRPEFEKQQQFLLQKQREQEILKQQQDEKQLQEQYLIKQQNDLETQRVIELQRQKEEEDQKLLEKQQRLKILEEQRLKQKQQREEEQRLLEEKMLLLQRQRQKELEEQRIRQEQLLLEKQKKEKELEEQRQLEEKRLRQLEEQKILQQRREKELEQQRYLLEQQRLKELEEERLLQEQRQKEIEEQRRLQRLKDIEEKRRAQQKQREQELQLYHFQRQKELEQQRLYEQQKKLENQKLIEQQKKLEEEQRLLQQQKQLEEERLLEQKKQYEEQVYLQQQKELEERRLLDLKQKKLLEEQENQKRLLEQQKKENQNRENIENSQHHFIQPQRLSPTVTELPNKNILPQIDNANFISQIEKETESENSDLVPHQPPLSIFYNSFQNEEPKISDVLRDLRSSSTITVLDQYFEKMPTVFVGPAGLVPPSGYRKFDLPYLSNIDSNLNDNKIDKYPFFVAPLNFVPPPGYSKIPFPSPHVGSVVVSTESNSLMSVPEVTINSQYQKEKEGDNLSVVGPELPGLINGLQTKTTTAKPSTASLPQTTAQIRNRRPNNGLYRPRKPVSTARPAVTIRPQTTTSKPEEVTKLSLKDENTDSGTSGVFRRPFNRFIRRRRPISTSTTEISIIHNDEEKLPENPKYQTEIRNQQKSSNFHRQQGAAYGDILKQKPVRQYGSQHYDRKSGGLSKSLVRPNPALFKLKQKDLPSTSEESSELDNINSQNYDDGPIPTGSAKTITHQLYRPNDLKLVNQQRLPQDSTTTFQAKIDTTPSSEYLFQDPDQRKLTEADQTEARPTIGYQAPTSLKYNEYQIISSTINSEEESEPIFSGPNTSKYYETEYAKTEDPNQSHSVANSQLPNSESYPKVGDNLSVAEFSKYHLREDQNSSENPKSKHIISTATGISQNLEAPFSESLSEEQQYQQFSKYGSIASVAANDFVPTGSSNQEYSTGFVKSTTKEQSYEDTSIDEASPTDPTFNSNSYTIGYPVYSEGTPTSATNVNNEQSSEISPSQDVNATPLPPTSSPVLYYSTPVTLSPSEESTTITETSTKVAPTTSFKSTIQTVTQETENFNDYNTDYNKEINIPQTSEENPYITPGIQTYNQNFDENLQPTVQTKFSSHATIKPKSRIKIKQSGQYSPHSFTSTQKQISRPQFESKYTENLNEETATKPNTHELTTVKPQKYNHFRGLKRPVKPIPETTEKPEQKTNVYTIRPPRRQLNPLTVSTKRIRRPTTPVPTVQTSSEGFGVSTYSQFEEAEYPVSGVSNDVYYDHTSVTPVRQKFRKQFGSSEFRKTTGGSYGLSLNIPSTIETYESRSEAFSPSAQEEVLDKDYSKSQTLGTLPQEESFQGEPFPQNHFQQETYSQDSLNEDQKHQDFSTDPSTIRTSSEGLLTSEILTQESIPHETFEKGSLPEEHLNSEVLSEESVVQKENSELNNSDSSLDVSDLILTTARSTAPEERFRTDQLQKFVENNKSFDPNSERKSGRRRIRVRVNKRPHENFETAESQNLRTVANVLVPPTSTYKPIDEGKVLQLSKNSEVSFRGTKSYGIRSREYFKKRLNLTNVDPITTKEELVKDYFSHFKDNASSVSQEDQRRPTFIGYHEKLLKSQDESLPQDTQENISENSKLLRPKYRVRKIIKHKGRKGISTDTQNLDISENEKYFGNTKGKQHTESGFENANLHENFNVSKVRTLVRYVKKNKYSPHTTEAQESGIRLEQTTENQEVVKLDSFVTNSGETLRFTSTEALDETTPYTSTEEQSSQKGTPTTYIDQGTHAMTSSSNKVDSLTTEEHISNTETVPKTFDEYITTEKSEIISHINSEYHTDTSESSQTVTNFSYDQNSTSKGENPSEITLINYTQIKNVEEKTLTPYLSTLSNDENVSIKNTETQTQDTESFATYFQQTSETPITETYEAKIESETEGDPTFLTAYQKTTSNHELEEDTESLSAGKHSTGTLKNSDSYETEKPYITYLPSGFDKFETEKFSTTLQSTASSLGFDETLSTKLTELPQSSSPATTDYKVLYKSKFNQGFRTIYQRPSLSSLGRKKGSFHSTTEKYTVKPNDKRIGDRFGISSYYKRKEDGKSEDKRADLDHSSDLISPTKSSFSYEGRKYTRNKSSGPAYFSKNKYIISGKTEVTSNLSDNHTTPSRKVTTQTKNESDEVTTEIPSTEPKNEIRNSQKFETTTELHETKNQDEELESYDTTISSTADESEEEDDEELGEYDTSSESYDKTTETIEKSTATDNSDETRSTIKLSETTTKINKITENNKNSDYQTEQTNVQTTLTSSAGTLQVETQPDLYRFAKNSFTFDGSGKFIGTINRAHVRNITADILENTATFSAPGLEKQNEIQALPTVTSETSLATSLSDDVTTTVKTDSTPESATNAESTTEYPKIEATTATEKISKDKVNKFIKTSTQTKITHETEICFRGKCIRTKSENPDEDLRLLVDSSVP